MAIWQQMTASSRDQRWTQHEREKAERAERRKAEAVLQSPARRILRDNGEAKRFAAATVQQPNCQLEPCLMTTLAEKVAAKSALYDRAEAVAERAVTNI